MRQHCFALLILATPVVAEDLDPAILEIEGDPEYGEYLSSECVTCHRLDGETEGIPSIVYFETEDFVILMHAYKSGEREHQVMQTITKRLGNEEIAALAAYFSSLNTE